MLSLSFCTVVAATSREPLLLDVLPPREPATPGRHPTTASAVSPGDAAHEAASVLVFMYRSVDGFADGPVTVLVVDELFVQRRLLLALGVITPRPVDDREVD